MKGLPTTAFISGNVYGLDSTDSQVIVDTLYGAVVRAIDSSTGQGYGAMTDKKGKFEFKLPPSTYNLKVNFIASNALIIRNVAIGSGEIVEFNAMLGFSYLGDSTVYIMQPDKTLKLLQRSAVENGK